MNQVKSRNGYRHDDSTINIVLLVLLLLLLLLLLTQAAGCQWTLDALTIARIITN